MMEMADEQPNPLQRLKLRTRSLKREVLAMYLAVRHPATPWYVKALAASVVVYALSPIDLIPDPVPVLGYLDDIIIVPLGVLAVRWMIPAGVLEECRTQASAGVAVSGAWKWLGGSTIAALWVLCLVWIIALAGRWIGQ